MMKEQDESILEVNLPKYLKNDIEALKKGEENNSSLLDCLYCEVQGSINSAFYDNEITEEQANFLRKKYLGLDNEPCKEIKDILVRECMKEVIETGKQWWQGWGELLEEYVPKIVHAGAKLDGDPYEKYGGLRLSVEYPIPAAASVLLDELENKSVKVCECCGKEATIKEKGGWYKAICDNCFKDW